MIKVYLNIAILLLLLPLIIHGNEYHHDAKATELLVYKTPTCGCCKKWINHIENKGFTAYSKDVQNISGLKVKLGIRPNHASCHTAISKNGFAFEGHVPAKFIQKFLSQEHPNAIGLSVPAMPVGSPGMEVEDRFMPYKILVLYKDGTSKVYASVNRYEDQF